MRYAGRERVYFLTFFLVIVEETFLSAPKKKKEGNLGKTLSGFGLFT